MSNVGELGPVVSHAAIRATAEKRHLNWPVFVMAFALVCTLAWNVALLWGLFQICKLVFA
jgi:hypothetical protein